MPEISRFLGIIIYMYYKGHAPAHFHAVYNEYTITVEINTRVVSGRFPKNALRAVLEWLDINKNNLLQNWDLAVKRMPLNQIDPLE